MKAKLLLTFLALLLTTTTDSFAVTAGYELDLCFAANEIGQREVITNYDSRSDMYVVKLKAKWDKFDPDLHQRGFWLQQSRGAKVISPTLPEGCKVFHIYGDLMGHEG